MNYAEYVLCKWKKRLWPAKVLSRDCASKTRQACKDGSPSLQVEILGRHIQANVHRKDVELLNEESIKDIASKLDQTVKDRKVMEELIYRRALREALDILHPGVPSKERSPSKTGRAAWKKTTEQSSSIHAAVHQQPSQNNKQKKRGKTHEASVGLLTVGTQNKCNLYSRKKAERSTSARSLVSKSSDLLGNRDLEDQPLCASKTIKPEKPKKGVRLKTSSKPSTNRRSPCFPKGDERHHRDKSARERSSPSSTSKYSVKMSTTETPKKGVRLKPASGPSANRRSLHFSKGAERHHHNKSVREKSSPSSTSKCSVTTSTPARSGHRAKLTPEKKTGGKLGDILSEKKQFPPRKYRKDSDGQRHPQGTLGTLLKQTPSLCWETCANGHETSACSSDPAGPILDCIQEESLCPCADRAENVQHCDFEDKGRGSPCDPVLGLSPIREPCLSFPLGDEVEAEDKEEEEELPSIILHQEPCSMEAGMLVWCKLPRQPYWPAVVKSVKRKVKKATVVIIEKQMDKKSRGFSTSFRNLKHYNCEEKQALIDKVRERYSDEISWCINLIRDYSIRVGCRSFTGTFLEYCKDDMSYPVRKETHYNLSQMTFPQIEEVDSEETPSEASPTKPAKKVLPNRMREARDKANKKIVEFIVKAKGADEHLHAILKSKKQSRWLKEFLKSPHPTCIETYLEDDNQQQLVLEYLQEVYWEVDAKLLPLSNCDSVKFILDVLFPEAIIYAISAVYQIDYKKAEEKYIKGPLLSQREREIFEEEIREKKRKQHLQRLTPCPEDSV